MYKIIHDIKQSHARAESGKQGAKAGIHTEERLTDRPIPSMAHVSGLVNHRLPGGAAPSGRMPCDYVRQSHSQAIRMASASDRFAMDECLPKWLVCMGLIRKQGLAVDSAVG